MIDTPDLKSKYTIIDMPRLEGTVTEIWIIKYMWVHGVGGWEAE